MNWFGSSTPKLSQLEITLKTIVDNYVSDVIEFGKLFDKEPIELDKIFVKYDKIKNHKTEYLTCKTSLRDTGKFDLAINPDIQKFKKYNELIYEYERRLLLLGINLKTKHIDITTASNTKLIDETRRIEQESKAKLASGLATIQEMKKTGETICETLEKDTRRIEGIYAELEGIESELSMANTRIAVLAKRLATDKVIIAGTALIVGGVATIAGLGATGIAVI
jgi:predicted metal-binding protein